MKTLNIIGCGKVGRTLGRLFMEQGLFQVQDVLNRSQESARTAVSFIGAGRAVSAFSLLRPADLQMIAASDGEIARCAADLATSGTVAGGEVVFHLSGALPSTILAPVLDRGASIASVHPVKSFADPHDSVATFPGTWCGIEGDPEAVELLTESFHAIGGATFPVDPAFKSIYHSGSVIVCNYLNSLVQAGVKAYQKAGLPPETALKVLEPLVRGTVENIFTLGPARALTGPIARGDVAVVSRQIDALEAWDPEIALLYRALGRLALELAEGRQEIETREISLLRERLAG